MPRTTPAYLRALGRNDPPAEFELNGGVYSLRRVFKHDFFAVTSLYEGAEGKVILKIGRQAWFAIVPLRWVGRILAGREAAALKRLKDVEGVPRLMGRWGTTGIVRRYIEGRPLERGLRVADDFHPRLREVVDQLHARKMAYVDLEKAENVLVGEDDRPYLIDFQIAWFWPAKFGGDLWPICAIRRWLQSGDLYHLNKLKRRTRPDLMSPEELASTYHRPWYVRCYTVATTPLRWARRRLLDRIDPRPPVGPGKGGRRLPHGERGRVAEDPLGGI